MSQTRTRIKICGITNRTDADAAIEAGADALGFIFVPESPRYVGNTPRLLQEIAECAPFVVRVGVCRTVSEIPNEMLPLLDMVQYYATPRPICRAILACRIQTHDHLDEIASLLHQQHPNALLLDTYHKDKLGGSGETFDWRLAVEAKARFALPLVLAGGLTPENVAQAVETVLPYAVDVSSGVEAEPGRKDKAKLRAFCHQVHAQSRNNRP